MQPFTDMAEAHEWTLRRLREMAGRLTEQAYLRASAATGRDDEEAQARWMLVFDRMARGLRLSIALEARLSRERRWDADELRQHLQGEKDEPRWRKTSSSEHEPRESDRERDDDGLPDDAPLAQRIDRLKSIIEDAGESAPVTYRFKTQAPALQPTERALRAGTSWRPDEPLDVLTPDELAELDHPPWRGSG